MSGARFNVTYDLVTPESAALGDVAESGFLDARESRHDIAELWGEAAGALKRQCAMTLREACDVFGRDWSHGLDGCDSGSFYSPAFVIDYRTGAEMRQAFHMPDNATAASMARVVRLLRGAR